MLEGFVFVDCLLREFNFSSEAKELTVVLEAYGPSGSNKTKGLLRVACIGLTHVEIRASAEFWIDILKPYDSDGADQRANEIIEILDSQDENHSRELRLSADMLKAVVNCEDIKCEFAAFI
jgi:hypothetical protein